MAQGSTIKTCRYASPLRCESCEAMNRYKKKYYKVFVKH